MGRKIGDEERSQIEVTRIITETHQSRLIFLCEGLRGDYMKVFMHHLKEYTAKKLEDGNIEYLPAEWIMQQADSILHSIDEEERRDEEGL